MADVSIEPTVETFAHIVRSYCEWAECDFGDPLYELRRARLLLAELHLAAIRLPLLGEAIDEEPDRLAHEDWYRFFHKYGALPLSHSLADDLADIYRNVKAGLSLFEEDRHAEAVWGSDSIRIRGAAPRRSAARPALVSFADRLMKSRSIEYLHPGAQPGDISNWSRFGCAIGNPRISAGLARSTP